MVDISPGFDMCKRFVSSSDVSLWAHLYRKFCTNKAFKKGEVNKLLAQRGMLAKHGSDSFLQTHEMLGPTMVSGCMTDLRNPLIFKD